MEFIFLGNQLWLDFLNTRIKQHGEWVDLLSSLEDFLRWLVETKTLNEAQAEDFLRRWSQPQRREEVMRQIRLFRAVLGAAAESMTEGETVPADGLNAINFVLRHQRRHSQIAYDDNILTVRSESEITEPVHLLGLIAESAALALAGNKLPIRKCENPICALHFLDTTKNHTRRWCSMETCGNRHKAAVHYNAVKTRR